MPIYKENLEQCTLCFFASAIQEVSVVSIECNNELTGDKSVRNTSAVYDQETLICDEYSSERDSVFPRRLPPSLDRGLTQNQRIASIPVRRHCWFCHLAQEVDKSKPRSGNVKRETPCTHSDDLANKDIIRSFSCSKCSANCIEPTKGYESYQPLISNGDDKGKRSSPIEAHVRMMAANETEKGPISTLPVCKERGNYNSRDDGFNRKIISLNEQTECVRILGNSRSSNPHLRNITWVHKPTTDESPSRTDDARNFNHSDPAFSDTSHSTDISENSSTNSENKKDHSLELHDSSLKLALEKVSERSEINHRVSKLQEDVARLKAQMGIGRVKDGDNKNEMSQLSFSQENYNLCLIPGKIKTYEQQRGLEKHLAKEYLAQLNYLDHQMKSELVYLQRDKEGIDYLSSMTFCWAPMMRP